MSGSKIPIVYKNATGSRDFKVLVFAKNASTSTASVHYAAWMVLSTQSQIKFKYPVDISVGCSFETDEQENTSGPFKAELGSTWTIMQSSPDASPDLEEGIKKSCCVYSYC